MDDFLKITPDDDGKPEAQEEEFNLVKVGDDINITKMNPTMKKIRVGAGWDLNLFGESELDLDISVFLLDKNNMTREDSDFVYYNNMETCEGAVRLLGDSRTGAGDGDDEVILIDLDGIPFDVMRLIFVLSIYKGEEKDQSFGQVRNTFLRLANEKDGLELLRYELDEDFKDKNETALVVASLNREGPKWHFTPLGEFVSGDLAMLVERYGMTVGQY